MVEGGTLLRCYTSQRGIEGSNPSSSAPEVPCLREEHRCKANSVFLKAGPLLTLQWFLPRTIRRRVSVRTFTGTSLSIGQQDVGCQERKAET